MPTQGNLFADLPEVPRSEISFKALKRPVWTENKAKLVAKYLYYFVMITRHGVYIDGFAGPKQPGRTGSWAAQLVLESEPRLLREFFLCDQDPTKIAYLKALLNQQPQIRGRHIEVLEGDFNNKVLQVLNSGKITEKKATFCLLDQFSTECHWNTVKALAEFKKEKKIEIFYFLASGWISRALTGFTKNTDIPELWWGRPDWRELATHKSHERAQIVCERFRIELGYAFAHPWPIYSNEGGGKVMFHMIHATDHPEGPKLMWRAYNNATNPPEFTKQTELVFDEVQSIASSYFVNA